MALFAGTYSHNIDKNNRLFIPAKLRDFLGKTFLLYKPLSGDKCLSGYTPEDWEEAIKIATADMPAGRERTDLLRDIYENLDVVEIDQQGRITIGADFCEYANLDKEVFLFGAGRHFEIWNRADYETMRAERDAARQAEKAKGKDTAIHLQF
ncbi:MAG TPA: cell division/cell wall cluster transcriptional repressor MraZ [Clostridia bacterium]|nr:cell division/cell wall cluster transcriptional repressor MraZ [Clostridia bacterium]